MYFNHYTNKPVKLAVDLVNTLQSDGDQIATASQLCEFLEQYRSLWKGVARSPKSAELKSIHELRSSLRQVMEAGDGEHATELINRILSGYGAMPRISSHSGKPHLHFEPIDSTMTSWLGATTGMGLAAVVVETGTDRFGVCEAKDCDDVYVDSSRNRSRRHCSGTCSNREAVAAHRRRRSESGD